MSYLLKSEVRNKLNDDNRHLVFEEERKIALLKNQLIEINLGAEEGLSMLNQYVRMQLDQSN